MTDPNKKRSFSQYQDSQQVFAMQIGQSFKSKPDFLGYWSQCLKVRISYPIFIQLYPFSCILHLYLI